MKSPVWDAREDIYQEAPNSNLGDDFINFTRDGHVPSSGFAEVADGAQGAVAVVASPTHSWLASALLIASSPISLHSCAHGLSVEFLVSSSLARSTALILTPRTTCAAGILNCLS